MSLLSERHLMTVVINMRKPYFIFKTYVMVMKVSCQSYAHALAVAIFCCVADRQAACYCHVAWCL